MMPVMHVRLDDRLIHGQVLIGWGSRYDYDAFVICDSDLARSDWEKEMYLAAVPGDKTGAVVAPEELPEFIEAYAGKKIILLLKSLKMLELLIDSGFSITDVIIGGLHDKPGKKHFYDYVFLNKEDEKIIKKILSSGIRIYCQDLPEHSSHEITAIDL